MSKAAICVWLKKKIQHLGDSLFPSVFILSETVGRFITACRDVNKTTVHINHRRAHSVQSPPQWTDQSTEKVTSQTVPRWEVPLTCFSVRGANCSGSAFWNAWFSTKTGCFETSNVVTVVICCIFLYLLLTALICKMFCRTKYEANSFLFLLNHQLKKKKEFKENSFQCRHKLVLFLAFKTFE